MSIWGRSSCAEYGWLVVGVGAEHDVEDVAAASGEADEGGGVFLAFGSFAVVVGAASEVCEGCEEEGAFEFAVDASGRCSPRMLVPEWWVTGAMPA